jgi:hypothetical protein
MIASIDAPVGRTRRPRASSSFFFSPVAGFVGLVSDAAFTDPVFVTVFRGMRRLSQMTGGMTRTAADRIDAAAHAK